MKKIVCILLAIFTLLPLTADATDMLMTVKNKDMGAAIVAPPQDSNASKNERTLISLPLPLTRYNLDGEPIFKLSADSKMHILILPVDTTVKNNNKRVGRLFINGTFKGDFKGVSVTDFTDSNSNLVYRTSDGKTETVYGLPKFKGASPAQIEKTNQQIEQRIQELNAPGYANKAIISAKKELKGYGMSNAQIDQYIKETFTADYVNKRIAKLKDYQTSYQAEQSKLKDITEFYKKSDDSGEGIAGIIQNNQQGEYLVIVSPSFASAKIYLFKNGVQAAANDIPLYFNVAQNSKKTKFAYRGQSIDSLDDSEIMVVDDGVEGKKYAWTSQPTYNVNDEVMYMATSTVPKTREDKTKINCKAVVGTKETYVQCNDPLFFFLTHQSPYFRFPMMSADGKTTVYSELTKEGVYPGNDYEKGITTPFESRLVVNGKLGTSHPYIDKPFFTSKGLAVLSYTVKEEQYVEWDGKKSPNFQAVGTSFTETLGFRGVSSLYAAISSLVRGDLGVDELKPELIVSPDGNGIAFAGYGKDGWNVMQDMQLIGTYKYSDQLSYSPDSKHLAYIAIIGNFEPLSNQSFWLGEGNTQSSDVVSSVMVDGKQINKHERVLYLQYSPEGVLTYVGRGQKQYTLYLNGKAFGEPFDRMLMPPRFKDGMVEVAGARGEKVILMRQPLSEVGDLAQMPVQGSTSSQSVTTPTATTSQGITLVKTIKNNLPSNLKAFREGAKKSTTFFSDIKDKNAVYAVSLAQEDKNGKTYHLYLLNDEAPSNFKIINPYYAVGKKAYSYAARIQTVNFASGLTTYGGPGITAISDDVKNFVGVGRHAKDSKNAFHLAEVIQADVASFQPLNTYFAKDKFSIFVEGSGYLEADVNTFKPINDQCGADKKAFFCGGYGNGAVRLPLMDAKTFKYLHDGVAYDATKVVYRTNILSDLDPATFKFIDAGADRYFVDKNAVYWLTSCMDNYPDCNILELIKYADPTTFSVVLGKSVVQAYVKDKKYVWRSMYLVDGADGATFSFLNEFGGYARDAKHIYWWSDLVPEADVKTFKLLDPVSKDVERYGVDVKHIYYRGDIVKDANAKTFKRPVEKY